MTRKQIALVQTSFKLVEPIADKAAALFYAKLFDDASELRGLFKGDLNEQGIKLMQIIGYAVENLGRIDELVPEIEALGARHLTYGVNERHYELVGTALIWTLEKALGRQFDAPTRRAWTEVYALLADTMKHGANKSSGAASS
jgi:hemoglobin-like flavoprotein